MFRTFTGFIACMIAMVSVSHAGDNIQFLYQTRVFLNDAPASGPVNMKFAIVDQSGGVLWNNDGTAGSEPIDAVTLNTRNGVVSVEIGDSSLTNMTGLHNIILHRRDGAKLRVWLDDTISGFQQFTPDTGINPNFLYMPEVSEDLTLYVDGATGDDGNTGLSPTTALLTIQAAVDKLPKIIRDDVDVVIDIADGVYREQVIVAGITTGYNSTVTLRGDETTTATMAASPSVRITASDDDVSSDRDYCLQIWKSNWIILEGIQFDMSRGYGVFALDHSRVVVQGCRFNDNGLINENSGMYSAVGSIASVVYSRFENNYIGIVAQGHTEMVVRDSIFTDHSNAAISAFATARMYTQGTIDISNSWYGVLIQQNSFYRNTATVSVSGSTYNDLFVRYSSGVMNLGTFPNSNIQIDAGSHSDGF